MRILVTGAAGGIGSVACRELHDAGHEVIATDRADRGNIPVKLHVADLLDRHAIAALCGRLDAVLHLGNHTDYKPRDPQLIFGENMVININVFAAAHAAGAKKMIFASSIQVISSQPRLPDNAVDPLPYLPLDGDVPDFSTNYYALSKACGENMLRFYSRVYGTQAIAIRFPSTNHPELYAGIAAEYPNVSPRAATMAFAYMTYADAGGFCAAVANADLPGYRCYQPSSRFNMIRRTTGQVIAEYLSDVPIRGTFEPDGTLVNLSRIAAETGWRPKD